MFEIVVLLVLVAAIVLVTSRWRISPFLALLGAALIGAFAFGLPTSEIVTTISDAFGGTLGNIGLVILFGTIIGVVLERSGAAIVMAEAIIKVVGERFPTLTMSLIGYVVSIPVFCDSGYVILNSLRKAVSLRTGASLVATAIALMTGLYATHTLVPPTPGPLAAASNLGIEDSVGVIIAYGLPVALVSALVALLFANAFLRRDVPLEPAGEDDVDEATDYAALRASYGRLPGTFAAFGPILLPLVLICVGSVANLPSAPLGEGTVLTVLDFAGTPVIALAVGMLASVGLLRGRGGRTAFNELVESAIRVAAPILLVTAAGAGFGAVLAASSLTDFLSENLATLGLGIAVPFLLAAALKTAQGSSTVAMVTSSALVAPLLGSLGLGTTQGTVLAVLAIGAGAMVVSHANDSYFWVVSRMSRIPVGTAYRTLTVATGIQGLAAFGAVAALSAVVL
ncbi:GntP family permease [Isoptericola cucumis]|uniref:Transporter n=1 Tax=Isoptericola cucumis TaxID=1776856 RepID=A0ABQ2B842_9MICO|nr:GntP family permease [Isoptericola cucumis]GGI08503.1 transporter [Isoptericola cucumis]